MKLKFVLIITSALLSVASFAHADSSQQNIMAGNYSVAGSFGYVNGTRASEYAYLAPAVEYFVADRFSVGGTVSAYFFGHSSNTYSLGPSLTYYFWQQDKMAAFAGLNALYNRYERTGDSYNFSYWSGLARLGLDYFITPAVSFGPVVTYNHTFKNSTDLIDNADDMSLVFQFSIYL